MIFLRGNTASQEVPLGYFVDSTDGNTEETGLTIANTDIKIWKTGATTLANKNSGGGTHISNGIYYATLDATDTNTYGPLKIFVHVSGALACALECCVLAEPVYDSFFPASSGAPLPVFGILDWGTAQASASGTLVHRSGLSWANDIPNGAQAIIYGGTGAGQTRFIYDFTGASDTSNISPAWTTTPSTDSLYVTVGGSPTPTDAAALPAVNTTHAAGTAWGSGAITAASIAADAITAAKIADGAIDAATFAAGAITASAIAADAIGASELATDAVTEIVNAVWAAATRSLTVLDEDSTTLDLDATIQAALSTAITNIASILALLDDPRTEPGQGAPAVNPDLATKIDYLYKAWRNRSTQTATTYSLYADDATTVDQKATVSDDGTTFVKGEVATGP